MWGSEEEHWAFIPLWVETRLVAVGTATLSSKSCFLEKQYSEDYKDICLVLKQWEKVIKLYSELGL